MQQAVLRLAIVVITVATRAGADTPPLQGPPVKLLVSVAIDGVSWPRLEQARPLLAGGLKRMLDEDHVFTGSRYQHLNTETSPGHAALSTGAPPRVTFVVGNRWFVRAPDGTTRVVSSIEQPAPPAVPGQPPLFYPEVEKDVLRVSTLGDALVQSRPDSQVVSLSANDRSAACLAAVGIQLPQATGKSLPPGRR
jgi:hypothetical protein